MHVGSPQGHGSTVKLLNNTTAAVNALAVAEALVAARPRASTPAKLREVMAAGSGGSAMLDLKAGPMLEHDFVPLFKTAHLLKDVRHTPSGGRAPGRRMALAETC